MTVGTILQTVVIVGAIAGAYAALRERLVKLETKVDAMWARYIAERGR